MSFRRLRYTVRISLFLPFTDIVRAPTLLCFIFHKKSISSFYSTAKTYSYYVGRQQSQTLSLLAQPERCSARARRARGPVQTARVLAAANGCRVPDPGHRAVAGARDMGRRQEARAHARVDGRRALCCHHVQLHHAAYSSDARQPAAGRGSAGQFHGFVSPWRARLQLLHRILRPGRTRSPPTGPPSTDDRSCSWPRNARRLVVAAQDPCDRVAGPGAAGIDRVRARLEGVVAGVPGAVDCRRAGGHSDWVGGCYRGLKLSFG
ncbi:hypothetical protein BC828DRAFT_21351 [Blastocladiella britannica]|nr:hypothetical protein BC828DRAFT_21351 [Blastocladiella britannica]